MDVEIERTYSSGRVPKYRPGFGPQRRLVSVLLDSNAHPDSVIHIDELGSWGLEPLFRGLFFFFDGLSRLRFLLSDRGFRN